MMLALACACAFQAEILGPPPNSEAREKVCPSSEIPEERLSWSVCGAYVLFLK